jgi:threonine dehydrogenase-like Zn-dependent dehydrogenase/predicted dehydrogenase
MKQVLQSLKNGVTRVADVPSPTVAKGNIGIRTTTTLISAGTERMMVDFGKANYLDKARQQPDKVKQVIDKIRTDGLIPTLEAVFGKLDQPLPLGYCNVGRVLEVGATVQDFAMGNRVVSNGKHAEVVSVPKNLCAVIPDSVSDEEAAFTVIGSIGLQGIRLIQPTLGETVVVTGLGLIGLVTVQLLRAHGCKVIGIDFDPAKLALARSFGAETVDLSIGEEPVIKTTALTHGRGVDAVLITASTKSNEPVHQAALMCRKRGRIVLVGVTGLELSRADFYEKELSFQVSCSYGPGRYDPNYEEKGQDYPIGFVRWTEQRNFEAVLDMLADGRLDVKSLISHRFALEEAEKAYEVVGGSEPSLGILLRYADESVKSDESIRSTTVQLTPASPVSGKPVVSFVGSGNYATMVLIPAFKKSGARLKSVASSGGVSGVHSGRKFGFEQTTTDTPSVFSDSEVNTVIVSTRHDSHARFVLDALRADKHVFVEKPLCRTLDEVAQIQDEMNLHPESQVMVGFNRRFAPHIVEMKRLLRGATGPKSFVITINAGAIPADHWTQDHAVGGGRIIGEGCHFIDLMRFLAASPIKDAQARAMTSLSSDTVSIDLSFEDGSIGTIHYFANGSKAFPKERVEVFANGGVLQLDNYRVLKGFGWKGAKTMRLWRQDKGQAACASAFISAIEHGTPAPIAREELLEVAKVTIELAESIR